MDSQEKIAKVTEEAILLDERLSSLLGVPIGAEGTHALLRNAMTKEQLILWDLTVFFEGETVRCQAAEAHFSAMLASVSMNEALLSLTCLMQREKVICTAPFLNWMKAHPSATLLLALSKWSLQPLISVATELNWLPAVVIDDQMKELLGEVFKELISSPVEGEFSLSGEEYQRLLSQDAGRTMLTLTQDLRNYVHPNRWLTRQDSFDSNSFNIWCRIAVRLSGEIRAALLVQAIKFQASESLVHVQRMQDISNSLSIEDRPVFDGLIRQQIFKTTGISLPESMPLTDVLRLLANPVEQS